MDYRAAVIAGVLQGLLEWLPVSSSGQLVLYYMKILGVEQGLALLGSYAAHLGTSLSAIPLVWREILDVVRAGKWLRVLVVPTLSAAPIGYVLINVSLELQARYINIMLGLLLVITGFILVTMSKREGVIGYREPWSLNVWELAIVGVIEGLAALPGLSRSAVTMASLLLLGVSPYYTVKTSILLGVPVTFAAGLYAGLGLQLELTVVLLFSSLFAGLLSASAMLYLAKRLNEKIGYFVVALGLIVLFVSLPEIT